MKNYLIVVLMLTGILTQSPAQGLERGYLGFNGGMMEIDNPNYDPSFNFGLTLGGIITKQGSMSLGAEAQVSTTAIDGDTSAGGNEWEIDSLGLFGALRYGSENYFKLKVGYLKWEITTDAALTNDSDFAWGLGFGLLMPSGNSLEIEYSIIGEIAGSDISYISISYLFK